MWSRVDRRWRRDWLGELVPGRLVPNVLAGAIVGLMSVAISVSLGALIYSGPLGAYQLNGIALALLSSAVVGLLVASFSSLPGMVADAQDAPAAILAVAAAGIASGMPAGAAPEATFATVVATMGATTVVTGLLFVVVGTLKLGRLVRYLPYPVVGGFLAGTGWLLLVGGLSLMAGFQPGPGQVMDLFATEVWLRWVPGVVFAIVILAVTQRFDHAMVWPVLLFGGTAAFFLAMAFLGGSPAGWREAGLLLGPFPDANLLRPFDPSDLRLVHWASVAQHGATAATVAFLSLMSVLFNATGLELATGRKVDLNRELRVPGIGNLFAGALGGIVGFQVLSFTILNYEAGTGSRVSALTAVAVIVATLLFGATMLGSIPTMVIGGLLVYLGLSFLNEWVYEAYRKLPRLEYAIAILILVTIATIGFLQGVGLGLVLAVVLFVVNYSRTEAIRHALSGAHYQSRVKRDPRERDYLAARGDDLLILQLQGFLFFGTAHTMLERVETRLNRTPSCRYLLLDFARVTGMDATALASFETLVRRARTGEFAVILTGLAPTVKRQLEHTGVRAASGGPVHTFESLDDGLEWCESRMLANADAAGQASPAFEERLEALMGGGVRFGDLLPYLDELEFQPGQLLMRQGDAPDVLYFVAEGQVTARLERPGDSHVRLETMRSGSLVGELGFYTGGIRTASVVADEASSVYRLSAEALERMTRDEPALAAVLHQLIVRLLADRVVHLMTVVRALQR